MKKQTLIISFLVLLSIFSCASKEGKKFLQKFQKDEKLKFEIEQKIADTNGISVIADIENSYYGIDGKLKNEEVIFVPVKTKGDLQVYGESLTANLGPPTRIEKRTASESQISGAVFYLRSSIWTVRRAPRLGRP